MEGLEAAKELQDQGADKKEVLKSRHKWLDLCKDILLGPPLPGGDSVPEPKVKAKAKAKK